MQFRDLQKQYITLKPDIDRAVSQVLTNANFISGPQVSELETALAAYTGTKHCITCANGTDALTLALMVWDIGPGDAVFVPDFTFFATAETPAYEGATPIFVDVEEDTFNLSPTSLEEAIVRVKEEGKLTPKVIITVDLFGQPADYPEIRKIAKRYGLLILEDGAQGFGGRIGEKKACSFGDISTTSFFPAKPLGCYGDGGAVFTDNEEWAKLLRSYRVHGKGTDKYDNVRIGINSRLDTLQAAVLLVKLRALEEYELEDVNQAAGHYTEGLKACEGHIKTPVVRDGFYSSWAQYTIQLESEAVRDRLERYLREKDIPTMVYYPKTMSCQGAFKGTECRNVNLSVAQSLCKRVLALPIHPYITGEEQAQVVERIKEFITVKPNLSSSPKSANFSCQFPCQA